MKGNGLPMHSSLNPAPNRVINFVQRKGVPMGMRGGDSTPSEDIKQREARGKDLVALWDTLKE